jgi:Fe-S cluster assembly protein SufD
MDDEASANFHGHILVAQDSQRTAAFQTNKNLLLTDKAHVTTKPFLEIYADDVKCSHGATTGYLNPDELFYLRSRGIPEVEARKMQMISFVSPVISHLPEDVKEQILSRL